MSRAMGDFELKNNINLDMRDQAISNEPEIRKVGVATYVHATHSFLPQASNTHIAEFPSTTGTSYSLCWLVTDSLM